MGYVSRRYLAEKWSRVKYDMERFLDIENVDLDDQITPDEVERCFYEIEDNMSAILRELEAGLDVRRK